MRLSCISVATSALASASRLSQRPFMGSGTFRLAIGLAFPSVRSFTPCRAMGVEHLVPEAVSYTHLDAADDM
eukprot:9874403-Alexandrium_andersonii.AAC.1